MADPTDELLQLSQELLDSIASGDWTTYTRLCDADLSAFEPEARGQRVIGLDFHRYYFDLGTPEQARHTTIVDPQIRLLGEDAALVTYIRLVQGQTPAGSVTTRCEETRVWERRDGSWKHVHFHRSENT
ncbi:MAG: DUF4440 domain-containing protein [Gemmatimonadetes bacterium]|jgi:hypothetical protein|nr:DUF4440 domain-containing protein [Gemmatimonadota bacterium]MBT6150106.1 DUF4440 domain-containing protein [Gemmatimonadota bacterium]MBT7862252.1 DUF4440 domain-containing protein [Gemmatimonadota bacterium]